MKKTYKNRLPENMVASSINANVVDGEVIVEVELKERFQPKDGDFLVTDKMNIFIYNPNYQPPFVPFYIDFNSYGQLAIHEEGGISGFGHFKDCRYATPEEKTAFLERLEKEFHMRWNPKTKELEDIRWRAKSGNRYYRVTISGEFEVEECLETKSSISHLDYRCSNYFRTPEAAKKVADQIREIFKNSKAE